MTRVINRFGDRVLTKLLGSTAAGACVPEQGEYCGCVLHEEYCYAHGETMARRYNHKYVNCVGACTGSALCRVETFWSSRCPK